MCIVQRHSINVSSDEFGHRYHRRQTNHVLFVIRSTFCAIFHFCNELEHVLCGGRPNYIYSYTESHSSVKTARFRFYCQRKSPLHIVFAHWRRQWWQHEISLFRFLHHHHQLHRLVVIHGLLFSCFILFVFTF